MNITAIIRAKKDEKHQCICENCGGNTYLYQGKGCDGCCEIWINGQCTTCGKLYELHFPESYFDYLYDEEQYAEIRRLAISDIKEKILIISRRFSLDLKQSEENLLQDVAHLVSIYL